MAPKAAPAARKISQEAFDAAVRENVEDLGMDELEALEDAVHTFKLQGVDLTGIITSGRSSEVHPVVAAIKDLESSILQTNDNAAGIQEALQRLKLVCSEEDNACIAVRNGGVQAAVSACKRLLSENDVESLATALEALLSLLSDEPSQREFDSCSGTEVVLACLELADTTGTIPKLAGQLVAASSSGNEILKEKFMQQKVEEVLVRLINCYREDATVLTGVFEALRALVTADDNRVLASNAFRNARRAAKAGVMEAILGASSALKEPHLVPTSCATLKALAVNEEICNSVAAMGGVNLVLQFLDDSAKVANVSLASNACSLLAQLAGSDANKDEIVEHGGCQKLVTVASCYFGDASVLQEVMSALACLCLRSPANASKAVEAGAIDLAAEVFEKHSSAGVVLRQTCQMLRNLAVRNPENRPLILERDLENLIRSAKSKHPICKDAAAAALRDLGLENYN